MFDWIRFLRAQGIHYVTRGPNVGAGQIGLHCPWCGPADPSQHLSVSLKGEGYRCWRQPRTHVGRARHRLIAALLNCSPEEAHRLAGDDLPATPEDIHLSAQLARLLGTPSAALTKLEPLKFPPEYKPLLASTGLARPFYDYLADPPQGERNPPRGLGAVGAAWAAENYGLRYATRGRDRYRISIPIHSADGKLMTWTARAINADPVRYKTLPGRLPYDDYTGPLARKAPGELLLGLPLLLAADPAELLVVCEGPFDAIKVTALGRKEGVYGTCLFGLEISESQALLIERLSTRFRHIMVLLDPDAAMLNLRVKGALTCRVTFGRLPPGVKDPGEFNRVTFNKFLQQERALL